jgi:uncharacterized SAM-binding protein YcdF (DUF218 family)
VLSDFRYNIVSITLREAKTTLVLMITLLISILGMLAGVIINLTDRRTILSGLFPLLSLLVLTTLLPVSWLALIIFLIVIPLGLIGEVLTYDGYWLTKHVGIGVKSLFFLVGGFLVMAFALMVPFLWLQMLTQPLIIVKVMLTVYGYVAILIDGYLLASLLNALPPHTSPTKIVILGAGLIKGQPGPVLVRRLKRGVALYRQFPNATLVMSGGQGIDEPVPEAVAMARFAIEHGVPKKSVLIESCSTNTATNIEKVQQFLRPFDQVILVTSDYHLLRALIYARKERIDCQGVAVHTPYLTFSVNALIRELGAFTIMHRILIPVGLLIGIGVTILL